MDLSRTFQRDSCGLPDRVSTALRVHKQPSIEDSGEGGAVVSRQENAGFRITIHLNRAAVLKMRANSDVQCITLRWQSHQCHRNFPLQFSLLVYSIVYHRSYFTCNLPLSLRMVSRKDKRAQAQDILPRIDCRNLKMRIENARS